MKSWAHELKQVEPHEFLRLLLPPLTAEERMIGGARRTISVASWVGLVVAALLAIWGFSLSA